ncbi:hypothetical protein JOD45_001415 [Scopulibacillus daqui]|uniref:ABC transporter permease n=1 Tax=Scopulibacillus daqui TaxID=1469162 RepID=A0ABS2PYS6_9BACL|nr:hypothetical protein [Scopulibacillus daqui]
MTAFIRAELLKMKSSLSRNLFLIIPIFFLLFAAFSNIYANKSQHPDANIFLTITYNYL